VTTPRRVGVFFFAFTAAIVAPLALFLTDSQARAARVQGRASPSLRELCRRSKVSYPPNRVFIRAFKAERELEVWGGNPTGKLRLLRRYPIAAASGGPGPKRCEGDMQVPEGVYHVARFNPHSRFHLSLGLNYPNASDQILGVHGHLGRDIYIHGNHVSAGCLAMTDPKIEEIYLLASHAKEAVVVHVFPCRMGGEQFARLERENPGLMSFWRQLEAIYSAFEAKHMVPRVSVGRDGAYLVRT
jgi:murein L,D-transpeptidase YafK